MLSYIRPNIWPFSSSTSNPVAGSSTAPDTIEENLSPPIQSLPLTPTSSPDVPTSPSTHPSRRSRSSTIDTRLIPYSTSSPLTNPHPLPPLSRVDPFIPQRAPPTGGPLAWDRTSWTQFAYFAYSKGWDIFGSLLSYSIYGPPKKSWGLEMTLIAAFMRNVGQHSALADIGLIRQLISFHSFLPLPPDAIVTPITFKVKKRVEGVDGLRGFFSELDKRETGKRELTGEWVVGKKVYKRLKAEKREERERIREKKERERTGEGDKAGVGAGEGGERKSRRKRSEKVIYYIHGGAYYVGSVATHRLITIAISKACNSRVFAVSYRLAPETRFPEPLLDVVNGYFRLIDDLGIEGRNIVVMGDSAGGGMALALTMYLRDEGYLDKLPRALVLMSPWVDLTMSCGSWDTNRKFDVVPTPGKDDHLNPVSCYLGPDGIRKYLTHPYASPLFGDLRDLPPMLIQAGDAEVLRDEITLLAHKAALSGVKVKHELHIDQVHVFQAFPFLESAQVAFGSIGRFVSGLKDERREEGVLEQSGKLERVDGERSTDGVMIARAPSPVDVDTVGDEIGGGQTKVVRRDGSEMDIDNSDSEMDEARLRSGSGTSGENKEDLSTERKYSTVPTRKTFSRSRSGSTPLASGSTPAATSPREKKKRQPLLRRALSGFSTMSRLEQQSLRIDTADLGQEQVLETQPLSPSRSAFSFFSGLTSSSSPVKENRPLPSSSLPSPSSSPTSTLRQPPPHRSRRPTVSTDATRSPAKPTSRGRSKSHSNIANMISSYKEGPANMTTVYVPTGKGNKGKEEESLDQTGDGQSSERIPGLGLSLDGDGDGNFDSADERRESMDSFI